MYCCYKCSKVVESGTAAPKIGFREACPQCNFDLHCCKNCKFFSPTAYNECAESSAERVVDKEKFNRCEYFEFRSANSATSQGSSDPRADARKKLDDLFK